MLDKLKKSISYQDRIAYATRSSCYAKLNIGTVIQASEKFIKVRRQDGERKVTLKHPERIVIVNG